MKQRSDFNPERWDERYKVRDTPWDIGYASPALMNFALKNISKTAKILIPGAGNGWEAEALHRMGYNNVWVCDWSSSAMEGFKMRVRDFPREHLLVTDYFQLEGPFDFILEQTFFSSLPKDLRAKYASKCQMLLQPGGILAGLLFMTEFEFDGPPFGGTIEEYKTLFTPFFNLLELAPSKDSIKPRLGKECFMILQAKK